MWSPLSDVLKTIAAFRFPYLGFRKSLIVGRPDVPDARGTADWRNFLTARDLSRVWGPHENSPWMPFHALTLFVALDYVKLKSVGPCDTDPWPVRKFQPPDWIDSHTLVLVDLPGPQSVALGACLGVMGCDLVCTFNNWPHTGGLLRSERTLAALLRYASWLAEKRMAFSTPGPVAWLCDAERLGTRKGKPGEFDNRYYIEDGLIPGPNLLKSHGISKIVYVATAVTSLKTSKIVYVAAAVTSLKADIGVHLKAYETAGLPIGFSAAGDDGTLSAPTSLDLPAAAFSTAGFFRSSAGGFGAPVPHPSSGG